MRWFKHMVFSSNDEKVSRLIDAHGLEGYGFWWRIVEIVAEKVDESDRSFAEFSPKKWGNLLGISPKKFRALAEFCANLGLFSLEFSENLIAVDIRNILKYRDEWTGRKARNSGAPREALTPSRARSSDTDIDPELEIELELNNNTAKPPFYTTSRGRRLAGKRLEAFKLFWKNFALAKGKAEAADAWLDIPDLTDELVKHICRAAGEEAGARSALEEKGGTPKWAHGWICARRWEDYPAQSDRPRQMARMPDLPPKLEVEPTPEEIAAGRERARMKLAKWRESRDSGNGDVIC